jgi:hypothetical protein
MKKSAKYFIPIATVAVLASGAYGIQQASAAPSTDSQQTLVDKLVTTFGLDKSKVQAVVDADRASHQADREAEYEARLNQAVIDGKITTAQKTLLLAEHKKIIAERQAKRISAATETQAQREANRAAEKAEIESWAKANNINASYLMGGGHGPGGERGMNPGSNNK